MPPVTLRHATAFSLVLLALAWGPANSAPKESASSTSKVSAAKHAATAPQREATPAPADDSQRVAANLIHYGDYACEFKQSISVTRDPQHEGYAVVQFGTRRFTMKPVLSSTGALRLEDVSGRTLMLQIAFKSMLMDMQRGQRLVDECVHPQQHAARLAAAAAPPQPGLGIDPDKPVVPPAASDAPAAQRPSSATAR